MSLMINNFRGFNSKETAGSDLLKSLNFSLNPVKHYYFFLQLTSTQLIYTKSQQMKTQLKRLESQSAGKNDQKLLNNGLNSKKFPYSNGD